MKRFFSLWLSVVLLLCFTISDSLAQSRDNLGKEFYVAFARNVGGEPNGNSQTIFALYLTSRTAATVNVEIPAINFNRTVTTTPGQITTVPLPIDVEITESEMVLRGMAVHITADQEIAVFGMNHKQFSTDAFMGLPVDVLGTEYRTMCFNSSAQGGQGSSTGGSFWITGINDGTNITITPKSSTMMGKPGGAPFTITLNKGDAYYVEGNPNDPENDLTGSLIESDLPIGVFSGHARAQIPEDAVNKETGGPSRDHLCEQLPPVSAWGDSAIVVPSATVTQPDLVRIVSAEDGNVIKVNGTVVTTLNAGDFYQITKLTGVTSIQASNPIMVGQYLHTSLHDNTHGAYGDPALALVFPVEQFTTSYTIVSVQNSAYTGNFVNIVVGADGVSSMTIDGVPIPVSNFIAIPGSNYVYAQLSLVQGTHNLAGAKPFGATVYGLGNVDSYSYTGGTLLKTITPLKTTDVIIDFKDRLLKPDLTGYFDTTVYLQNISSDPIAVNGFINRVQDTSKFHVVKPNPPLTLAAGQMDSMTIRFEPHEINRRMHTQVTAKTEHLRAYVVEVYGRGVWDGPMSYHQPLVSSDNEVDTLYFGISGKGGPPVDSTIYIGNNGLGVMDVDSMYVYGQDASAFSLQGFSLKGITKLPLTIDTNRVDFIRTDLRFTPDQVNGTKVARFRVVSKNGMRREVVLIARVSTVEGLSLDAPAFDSIQRCRDEERTITINNTNDATIVIDSIVIDGAGKGNYIISNPLPLSLAPLQQTQLTIKFIGNESGEQQATATVYFDLPKGHTQTLSLNGFVIGHPLQFRAPAELHLLANEEFNLPIYALSDLTPYKAKKWTLELHYDSVYLEDEDVILDNTLSSQFYVTDMQGDIGNRIYTFETYPDTMLAGGGPNEQLPLINVKFKTVLENADSIDRAQHLKIDYKISLNDIEYDTNCIDYNHTITEIYIDSVCSVARLKVGDDPPSATYIEQNSPNPFNPTTVIKYDISSEGPVELAVIDGNGRIVRELVNEVQKPGYYSAMFNAQGLASGVYYARLHSGKFLKTRKMVLVK